MLDPFDIIEQPLNLISLLILVLVIVIVFNPFGLRDTLFQYVRIDIDINFERISGDFFNWVKLRVFNESGSTSDTTP